MRLDELMRALPPATRAKLPKPLQNFKVATRSWLVQLYYADPAIHYEVVTLGVKRRQLEIGLHFESRNAAINEQLLDGFARQAFCVSGFDFKDFEWGMTGQFQELVGIQIKMIGQQDARLHGRPLTDAEDAPHGLMIEPGAQRGLAITLIAFGEQLFDPGSQGFRIVALLQSATTGSGRRSSIGHGI